MKHEKDDAQAQQLHWMKRHNKLLDECASLKRTIEAMLRKDAKHTNFLDRIKNMEDDSLKMVELCRVHTLEMEEWESERRKLESFVDHMVDINGTLMKRS